MGIFEKTNQPTTGGASAAFPTTTPDSATGLAAQLAAKHKGKRGRPPGSKNRPKDSPPVVANAPGAPKADSGERNRLVNRKYIKSAVESALKTLDAWDVKDCYITAKRYGADDAAAKHICEGVALSKDELEQVPELICACAEKYDWTSKIGPEIALSVVAIGLIYRKAEGRARLFQMHREYVKAMYAQQKGENALGPSIQ